jgi:alkylated DNA repair protein (DNA oxidative demethylase)
MRPDALPLEFDQPRVATRVRLGPQAIVLTGFAESEASALLAAIEDIRRASPLRHMVTPGGWTMSDRLPPPPLKEWVLRPAAGAPA